MGLKEKINELKEKIANLDALSTNIQNAGDVADLFNKYWPTIEEVLEFIKDRKVTRAKTDKKLQAVIDQGNAIAAVTNDPAALQAKLADFKETIDKIDDQLDNIISNLSKIERWTRDGSTFDNLLDKAIDFLTKVSKVLDEIEDRLTT